MILFILGAALAVAFWPLWIGAAVSPRWAVAALIACLAAWMPPRPTAAHWWGLAFLAWCLLTTVWAEARLDSVAAGARLLLGGLLFLVGAGIGSLRWFYRGAGAGLAVSVAIAAAWAYGINIIPAKTPGAGLFVNSFFLVEASALIGIALIAQRDWLWAVPLAPVVAISHGRGAILAFAIGLVFLFRKRLVLTIPMLAICAIVALVIFRETALSMVGINYRLYVWYDAINATTLLGRGIGNFSYLFPLFADHTDTATMFADHPHNMAIEIAFECGLVGLCLAAMFFLTLLDAPSLRPETYVLIVFLMDGLYAFPEHMPFTFAVAALAAGRLSVNLPVVRLSALLSRATLFRGARSEAGDHAGSDADGGPEIGGRLRGGGAVISVERPVSHGHSEEPVRPHEQDSGARRTGPDGR